MAAVISVHAGSLGQPKVGKFFNLSIEYGSGFNLIGFVGRFMVRYVGVYSACLYFYLLIFIWRFGLFELHLVHWGMWGSGESIRWSAKHGVIHVFQHKAFTEVFLDDAHSPANRRVSVQVTTPALHLSVRFPIPDLRSDQERGPWFKKSLQKETLHLAFTDLESKTEFVGGSTPEQTKLELTFRELTGKTEQTHLWRSRLCTELCSWQHPGWQNWEHRENRATAFLQNCVEM